MTNELLFVAFGMIGYGVVAISTQPWNASGWWYYVSSFTVIPSLVLGVLLLILFYGGLLD